MRQRVLASAHCITDGTTADQSSYLDDAPYGVVLRETILVVRVLPRNLRNGQSAEAVVPELAAAPIGGPLGNHLIEGIVPVVGDKGMMGCQARPGGAGGSYLFKPVGIRDLLDTGRWDSFEQVTCLIVVVERVMQYSATWWSTVNVSCW